MLTPYFTKLNLLTVTFVILASDSHCLAVFICLSDCSCTFVPVIKYVYEKIRYKIHFIEVIKLNGFATHIAIHIFRPTFPGSPVVSVRNSFASRSYSPKGHSGLKWTSPLQCDSKNILWNNCIE